jgi:hypothetical protein
LTFGAIAPTSDRVLLSRSARGHPVRLLPENPETPAATMLRWLQLVKSNDASLSEVIGSSQSKIKNAKNVVNLKREDYLTLDENR